MKITRDQLRIMNRHSIEDTNILDGGNLTKKALYQLAKQEECEFIYWIPCRVCDCKIRTRHGICVECNPAAISYMRQYGSSGHVYVAWTEMGKFVKIGSSKNLDNRISVMKCGYANQNDWSIFGSKHVSDMGKCENEMKSTFIDFKFKRKYLHSDGKTLYATEIFHLDPSQAYSTLVDISKNF